jgi:hypothetical protein
LTSEAIGADKVDVLLYEAASTTLVALGTRASGVARHQQELGLDRLPLAMSEPLAARFRTGVPYRTEHADQDPDSPAAWWRALVPAANSTWLPAMRSSLNGSA